MNTHTVSVINQKGGVGKSTTAAALASGLKHKGYKVLAIDLDSQCNLSFIAGSSEDSPSILDVITDYSEALNAIQHLESMDLIRADKALASADIRLTGTGKEYKLQEALDSLQGIYDYIVIDTPPTLGILTVNALTASNDIIIPALADIFSLQGIDRLMETITPVKKYCNHSLSITGILLTKYSPRTILSKDIAGSAEKLAEKLDTRLFKTTIREAVAIREAQIQQKDIYTYAPKAKATQDYRSFVNELLAIYQEEGNNK